MGLIFLAHAQVFDVEVAARAGVEEQIPARMMVIVVDINLMVIPLPIATTVEIVRGHDQIGIIVEGHAARAIVDATGYEDLSHMFVAALGIGAAGMKA